MAKLNALEALYNKQRSPLEFNFDTLTAPPLYSLLTQQDIYNLNQIARSVKLSGKIDEKYKLIDQIMTSRGFVKLHAGTNRVVYRFIEDQRFVIKVAIDKVGLGDNPAEFQNQFLLKPFVTKVFEVSPCGTVGLFERVDAIMSREEFLSVADDIFNLITKFFVGKYVLEDFGSWYFLNWGIRRNGMGLVLLDFPYVYELDGNKLYCNANPIPGRRDIVCNGEIDYDDGFNNLICTKCGRHYQARSLKKAEEQKLIIVGGKKTMKVQVKVGKKVILDSNKSKVAKVIEPENNNVKVRLPKEENVVKAPKEKVRHDRVESRSKEVLKKEEVKKEQPKEAIFKGIKTLNEEKEVKMVEKVEEPVIITEDKKESDTVTIDEVVTPVDDMTLELDSEVMNDTDDYDEEDDWEEYDQYVSNRQRSQDRSRAKQSKKGNNDFKGF